MTKKGISKAIHAANRYENFPVGSLIVPKKHRSFIVNVYNFARLADDIADEGKLNNDERLKLLDLFEKVLKNPSHYKFKNEKKNLKIEQKIINVTLMTHLICNESPVFKNLLLKLLKAFRYDASFKPFENWDEIYNYCENSANPIGRILLELFEIPKFSNGIETKNLIFFMSDSICTGLQIINFAQDSKEDDFKGRPTFPKNIWPENITHIKKEQFSKLSSNVKLALVEKLAIKGIEKLNDGKNLPKILRNINTKFSFRFALEISLIIECGLNISKKILKNPNCVWTKPPKLKLYQFPKIFFYSLINVILK